MGIGEGISIITVFVQGLLSFFSPCVLPLLPLYIGYLAGGAGERQPDGTIVYPRMKVLVNTIFFVIGVSFAFFLLGFGFTAVGQALGGSSWLFTGLAGIIMVVFGLYMLGLFGKNRAIETERKLPIDLSRFAMNPLVALVLGFTFSFAWTPCIGPVLTSVLLMASSSATAFEGFALVGVYTLGFVLPFLAVGFFTTEVLRFFRTHGHVVRYTVKIGGALLIVMGLLTMTGLMNNASAMLGKLTNGTPALEQTQNAPEATAPEDDEEGKAPAAENAGEAGGTGGEADEQSAEAAATANGEADDSSAAATMRAPLADLSLKDQSGASLKLEDFKGKVIFVNFFATWCGPCQSEIPDIEALYKDYGANKKDVAIVAAANPSSSQNPYNADVSEGEIKSFIKSMGITYPVLMDTTGELFYAYRVEAFPTSVIIGKDGQVLQSIPGAMSEREIRGLIDNALAA